MGGRTFLSAYAWRTGMSLLFLLCLNPPRRMVSLSSNHALIIFSNLSIAGRKAVLRYIIRCFCRSSPTKAIVLIGLKLITIKIVDNELQLSNETDTERFSDLKINNFDRTRNQQHHTYTRRAVRSMIGRLGSHGMISPLGCGETPHC